ncbi:MAG: GatB/YqeY domain-containing protein [Sphingomonadales bacterium]|nr:GatB/YqeY domain-containing protein [Sphingomonadales bacterium]
MIRDDIKAAQIDAMKAGDKARLGTIRLMLAKIKDRDIELRVATAVGDDDVIVTDACGSTTSNSATLTVNTFSNKRYAKAGMSFRDFIKQSFETVQRSEIRSLILDIRENGGGSEGNEDYLFSYLTEKPYNKYKYVQASALSYSFYRYTDYSAEVDYKQLEADLQNEHERADDGRILRRPGIETPEPIQQAPFRGALYVLVSGWTYSGGAELASKGGRSASSPTSARTRLIVLRLAASAPPTSARSCRSSTSRSAAAGGSRSTTSSSPTPSSSSSARIRACARCCGGPHVPNQPSLDGLKM